MATGKMDVKSECEYKFEIGSKITHKKITLSLKEELQDKELQQLFRILLRDVCSRGFELYSNCISNLDECHKSDFFSEKLYNACCLTYISRCDARIKLLEVFGEAFESREKLLRMEARVRSKDPVVLKLLLEDNAYAQIIKKRKLEESEKTD